MFGSGSFYYKDYGVLGYPFIFYQHESFWQGEFPLWNPLSNCGAPFHAQWGTMTAYPLSLIYLIFPLPWSLSYFCLLHVALGGFGMFFLARRWAGGSFACGLAGMVYVFNGVAFSCMAWPNYLVALGWMPWVVLLVERGWKQGGRWLALSAGVSALQLLAGVPEVAMMTWLFLGGLWLVHFREGVVPGRKLGLRLGVVMLLAAGLCAVQLLPFFDLLNHSQRDQHFSNTKWPMPGWGWANLFVPLFHCFETFQGPFCQTGQEFMSSYYLGIAMLLFGLWGAWKVRQPQVWLVTGALLLSLILALGENGYLLPWLKKFCPWLNIARYPVKFVVLAGFALPLLTAYAAREAEANAKQAPRAMAWLGIIGLALTGAVLWFANSYPFPMEQLDRTQGNGWLRVAFCLATLTALGAGFRAKKGQVRFILQGSVAVLLVGDVLTHHVKLNPVIATEFFQPGAWNEAASGPAPKPGESRIFITAKAEKVLLRSEVREGELDFGGKRQAEWSNLNVLDGIPKVNGSSTLQIKEQMEVQNLLYKSPMPPAEGLLDFLGVTHVTSPESAIEWVKRTNACALITVGAQPVFRGPEVTLQKLNGNEFNPRLIVYLPLEAAGHVRATNATEARIISQKFGKQNIEADIALKEPGWVMIAQSYYHPWHALVDGSPARLWKANYAFQAVELPAGEHKLELVYKDRAFQIGALISVLSLFGCCGIWLNDRAEGRARQDVRELLVETFGSEPVPAQQS
ncbi:MAG TPA: YfhO family protein [Verrucomicrobiae bacterium]